MKLPANAPGVPVARSRILRLLVLALVVLPALRCGDAPTQPLAPMAPSAVAPAPVAINLGGSWHGTFSFLSCTSQVAVTLTQTGNTISGHLAPPCAPGPGIGNNLSGTLTGSSLAVQLIFEGSRYNLSGTASSFRIDVNYGGNESAMSLHLVRSFSPRQ